MSEADNPIACLKDWAKTLCYTVIDPNLSDANEKLFLESVVRALETASQLKKQQYIRSNRVKESTLNILKGNLEKQPPTKLR